MKIRTILLSLLVILCGCVQQNVQKYENEKENGSLIEWMKPQKANSLKLFPTYQKEKDTMEEEIFFEDNTEYYKVGRITTGDYKDAEVLLAISPSNLPVAFPALFRFIQKGDELIFLKEYSQQIEADKFSRKGILFTTPPELEKVMRDAFSTPEKVEFPAPQIKKSSSRTAYVLRRETKTPVFFSEKNLIPFYSSENGRQFFIEQNKKNTWSEGDAGIFQSNGIFLPLPDGTTVLYSLDIPFMNDEFVPQINWEIGPGGTDRYTFSEGWSCGYRKGAFANIVHDTITMSSYAKEDAVASGYPEAVESIIEVPISENDLEITGYTETDHEPIFTFKDTNHPVLKKFYERNYSIAFRNVNDGVIISYPEYVQRRPFFFWKDPFGRMVMFINGSFYFSPVCAAKPVIYLYPKQEQDISVQLRTPGELTVSYPEYGNGWKVRASQEGDITDLSSGIQAPYLFWEALLHYDAPKDGFVVKNSEVQDFLTDKLSYMGLNDTEIGDFQQFWLPKMKNAPYYFITFLQTDEMNELAPLKIEPSPDTIIRVFMHFKPLQNHISVSALDLHRNERRGFTVVEWGGSLDE